jgi:hypothetical protein
MIRLPSALSFVALSQAFLLLIACGGSSRPGPKPLQFRYDEVYIAQFSLEEKAAVLKAQNEYQMARAEQMKAESDLNESKTKLNVAKNERKQALLSEQSAQQEKQAADKSGDMTRINRAARDMRVAELSRRAADDKVAYIKANRAYLGKLVRYRAEETYHREARYEHEKAKLGQSKNIAPKGVNYEKFKGQTEERSRLAQKARQEFERDKLKAAEATKTWQGRIQEANQAKGIKSEPSTGATGTTTSEEGN